jgi:uncharacterized protein
LTIHYSPLTKKLPWFTSIFDLMKQTTRRIIKRTVIVVLLVYAILGITLYFIQELIFFHPDPVSADYKYKFDQPFTELNLAVGKHNLHIVQFKPATAPKGLVLFLHGNMSNVQHYAKYVSIFTRNGYELWMHDYPGFGKTTGDRSEQRMYSDALRVYEMAAKTVEPERIIIYGKSIGTGVASFLASETKSKLLILETPYYNIGSLARKFIPIYPYPNLLKYEFPTNRYLKSVEEPVVLIHGTRDELIPYEHALNLRKENQHASLISISGGRHNDLSSFSAFQHTLDSLLR